MSDLIVSFIQFFNLAPHGIVQSLNFAWNLAHSKLIFLKVASILLIFLDRNLELCEKLLISPDDLSLLRYFSL